MKQLSLLLCLAASIACYDPHAQNSKIVREVEAAGAGNLSTYTQPGLVQWFSSRPELAKKIAAECQPISRTASADWLTTSEGTVCHAAELMEPPPQYKADQRTW